MAIATLALAAAVTPRLIARGALPLSWRLMRRVLRIARGCYCVSHRYIACERNTATRLSITRHASLVAVTATIAAAATALSFSAFPALLRCLPPLACLSRLAIARLPWLPWFPWFPWFSRLLPLFTRLPPTLPLQVAGHLIHGGFTGGRRQARFKARNHRLIDCAAHQLFDFREQRHFVGGHQRYRFAGAASAAGAANAVHIVFGDMRHVVIHHMRQFFDIEPACGQIGGDQHAHQAGFEIGQRLGSCALAFVAVNRGR